VIPQQEKGNPSEELQLHYQFLFQGVSQNSLSKNMFVFGDQYSLMFKLAVILQQFFGRQSIKSLELHDEVSICQQIKSLI